MHRVLVKTDVPMGYNWQKKNYVIILATIMMATARCKWCGKEMPVEVLAQFGGYCCPAHYQAGLQRQR